MNARRLKLALVLAAVMAVVAMAVPAALAAGTRTEISLRPSSAFPGASGKARYTVNGTERELQIEVEGIRRLAGRHVNVFVNGSKLASPLVSTLGQVRVERNTDRGHAVPRISRGSTVRVRTLDGTLIVSGTF
jgi:predicted PilT family ATPase